LQLFNENAPLALFYEYSQLDQQPLEIEDSQGLEGLASAISR